ncbi:hypothetical protein [Ruegeria sp. HKCCD7255]|uniref:lipase/acyltransferase domain-containing protein n=1 Tax=Ruegeria sp. HKCCD7255 TaxID=2683004 RepID=UPI001488F8D1|nr:hypothetical protein [Ruegeria sp. HKCCD7255]
MLSFFRIYLLLSFAAFGAMPVSANQNRNLIVVPGIFGSVLSDEAGNPVWGKANSITRKQFTRLNLLPVGSDPEDLAATDVLREIPLVFGAFSIGLYGPLIDELTKVQTGPAITPELRGKAKYTEGDNLFVFKYDWRRSNFANAKHLNDFIKEKVPDGEQYDLVAHSMGGLITRIFLNEVRPRDVCTDPTTTIDLTSTELRSLCSALYGHLSKGIWPSDVLNASYSEADRLHTFVEIAVPHRGSVNVAATFAEGWGLVTDVFLGGKRPIQNIILSFVSPWELAPTYDGCCALGKQENTGINPRGELPNKEVEPLNREFWLEKILGFGLSNCPYNNCKLKKKVVEIGLNNRALIDQVIDAGVPDSVQSHYVIVGRYVGDSYDTVYINHNSEGDGDMIEFRSTVRGDGTVIEWSAASEDGSLNYASRSKHAFIVGSPAVAEHLKHMVVDPIIDRPTLVSNNTILFAGGHVETIEFGASTQFIREGASLQVNLSMSEFSAFRFDRQSASQLDVVFSFEAYAGEASTSQVSAKIADPNLLANGTAVFQAELNAPETTGVYALVASSDGNELMREVIYVMDQEK